jgi:hypothetical protein
MYDSFWKLIFLKEERMMKTKLVPLVLTVVIMCSSASLTYALVYIINIEGLVYPNSAWDSTLAHMGYDPVCELYFELVDPLAYTHPDAGCTNMPLKLSYDALVKKTRAVRTAPEMKSMQIAISRRFHEIGVEACTKATDIRDPVLWYYYGDYPTLVRSMQANRVCAQRRTELERTAMTH